MSKFLKRALAVAILVGTFAACLWTFPLVTLYIVWVFAMMGLVGAIMWAIQTLTGQRLL